MALSAKERRGIEAGFRSMSLRDLDLWRLRGNTPEVEAIRAKVRSERACECGQTLFTPGHHAFCMNCAGHNPVCSGQHCDRHPKMLSTWTAYGQHGCEVDS